jgi:hypothetical protein
MFAPDLQPRLREAVHDLSWLLGREYAPVSALKLVGDRYTLDQRQRIAVGRCACSDEARHRRNCSRLELAQLAGQPLLIDGYNLVTSVEAALAGGVILAARDGCFRDMASVHGTWRKVEETIPAVELVGQFLAKLGVTRVVWYFDSPVSNSGRLKTMLRVTATQHGWPWEIELVPNPDAVLSQAEEIVATADSGILEVCRRWVNLAREVIERVIPQANIVRMSDLTGGPSPA